uniref:Clp protease n=1 Tax=Amorphochlora amoebiformis TaxID=1561963 RepID=A0A6T6SMT7_9EUKA|mmetsp:Transcript_14981/g.23729  ORF Transcript_14981/g.23729 Transcript_14981/m.23729 type:complete len:183 (+) Transcript_14981:259-807(+)
MKSSLHSIKMIKGNRILYVNKTLNNELLVSLISEMLYIKKNDSIKNLYIFINCISSDLNQFLSFDDFISYYKFSYRPVGLGKVYENGLLILSGGEKEHRNCLINTTLAISNYKELISDEKSVLVSKSNTISRVSLLLERYFAKNAAIYLQNKIKYKMFNPRYIYISKKEAKKLNIIDRIIIN